jgi:orotate phosphoribosyltransferase
VQAPDASAGTARFIALLIDSNIVKFGKFRLKNGTESDYFLDFGALERGSSLLELGACYAEKIHDEIGVENVDVVFGPAYKGIPLALATVIALHTQYGITRAYSCDRKEEKDHGEGGLFIGRRPAKGDRVLIVDDVITDGGTKVSSVKLITEVTEAKVVGVLVGVDRSAPGVVETFERETGVKLYAIAQAVEVQAAARR